jgi:hypothetical protein
MVQDTSASPEMYLAEAGDHKYGGWGAAHDTAQEEIDYENLRECSILWAVSIPGESDWISKGQQSPTASVSNQAHKYPVPAARHVGLQLKVLIKYHPKYCLHFSQVYDAPAAEALKTTDIATFVGLLSSEP